MGRSKLAPLVTELKWFTLCQFPNYFNVPYCLLLDQIKKILVAVEMIIVDQIFFLVKLIYFRLIYLRRSWLNFFFVYLLFNESIVAGDTVWSEWNRLQRLFSFVYQFKRRFTQTNNPPF